MERDVPRRYQAIILFADPTEAGHLLDLKCEPGVVSGRQFRDLESAQSHSAQIAIADHRGLSRNLIPGDQYNS